MSAQKPRKGVYLLPNLLTSIGLLAGFYAIITAINGQYETSAIAIFIAMVFDGLDGRVARLTNTQSDFGAEYDSMADMVSFGVAPAILLYTWQLSTLGNVGIFAAFLYIAAGALRLARFNTQIGIEDKNYFQGLPSPAAAALIAGLVWFVHDYHLENIEAITAFLPYISLVFMVLSGLLMVSNVRYSSFKDVNLKQRTSFKIILLVVLVIILVSVQPSAVLFIVFLTYAVSGVLLTIAGLRQKRLRKKK